MFYKENTSATSLKLLVFIRLIKFETVTSKRDGKDIKQTTATGS